MGMDLYVAGGTERFSYGSWRMMLRLAHKYGWKPMGTEPGQWGNAGAGESNAQPSSHPDRWDGTYFSNDCQWLTYDDAVRIADALERALDDMPSSDTDEQLMQHVPTESSDEQTVERMVEHGCTIYGSHEGLRPGGFVSSEVKQEIRNFVAFCRAGGFYIA